MEIRRKKLESLMEIRRKKLESMHLSKMMMGTDENQKRNVMKTRIQMRMNVDYCQMRD